MKSLSVKDIAKFRRKSDRSKKTFVANLSLDKEKSEEGGGDYWVSCLSAISNSYRNNNLSHIHDKIVNLGEKHEETEKSGTKTMYSRNIQVLNNYQEFDLSQWRPSEKLTFIRKVKEDFVLTIKGLKIKITPQYVFTYTKEEEKHIGAIWFVSQLNGFRKEELGMFTEALYRYLKSFFSKDYALDTEYCLAVDVFNAFEVSYHQLDTKEIPMVLNNTLDEIKGLM